MRKSVDLTLAKFTLIGVLMSIMLSPVLIAPALAYGQDYHMTGDWNTDINHSGDTWGVETMLVCWQADLRTTGHVNSYVSVGIKRVPPDYKKNMIEMGWIRKYGGSWGNILRGYIVWIKDDVVYEEPRDPININDWHNYRIASSYLGSRYWFAAFDGRVLRDWFNYFPCDTGWIGAHGENKVDPWPPRNVMYGKFDNLKYCYNYQWSLWNTIATEEDYPYHAHSPPGCPDQLEVFGPQY